MSEVFAGFVCGYTLAIISTPLLALQLLRLRAGSELFARLLPAGTSAVMLGVLLHGALFLFWTAAGIVLGLVLFAMRDAGGTLGSANAPFSLFVAGLALMLAAPVVIALPRLRRAAIVGAVLFLAVFGGLMPYMAGWTTFEAEEAPTERPGFSHAVAADEN